jgi:hypothetical protein
MVVSDVYHVVGIDRSKRGKTIAHDGKKSDKNIVNDMNDI